MLKTKVFKPMAALFATLLFVFSGSIPVTVQAASSIIHISSGFDNLFAKMTNMAPGTTVTDSFTVTNISQKPAHFFLESKEALESDFDSAGKQRESDTILSILDLQVTLFELQKGGAVRPESAVLLYDGKANQLSPNTGSAALIGQQLQLGDLAPGQSVVIQIAVSAPLAAINNSHLGMQGKFRWDFTAAEIVEQPDSSSPSAPPASSGSDGGGANSSPSNGGNGGGQGGTAPNTNPPAAQNGTSQPAGAAASGSLPNSNTAASQSDAASSALLQNIIPPTVTVGDTTIPLFGRGNVLGIVNIILALLGFILSAATALQMVLRKKRAARFKAVYGEEYTGQKNRIQAVSPLRQLFVLGFGGLTVLIFLLTSNFNSSFVLVDSWTLLVLMPFLAQVTFLVLGRFKRQKPLV